MQKSDEDWLLVRNRLSKYKNFFFFMIILIEISVQTFHLVSPATLCIPCRMLRIGALLWLAVVVCGKGLNSEQIECANTRYTASSHLCGLLSIPEARGSAQKKCAAAFC